MAPSDSVDLPSRPSPPALSGSDGVFPAHLAALKRRLVPPAAEPAVVAAWNDVLAELARFTTQAQATGPDIIPQIQFDQISSLSEDQRNLIKRRGCVVIRNVVPDDEALAWKQQLRDYVAANPSVNGFPEGNKQFFEIYWSASQLRARSHPNVLAVSSFLNSLYHSGSDSSSDAPVSLRSPLSYADRFRIRHPGPVKWNVHKPHIDGASIERWQDDDIRACYQSILHGDWRAHDPYAIDGRLLGNTDVYGRPNQASFPLSNFIHSLFSSVFRTWQGWLSMSETGPNEGTLKLFPDVLLSNSYLILRPFFRPSNPLAPDLLDPANWLLDLNSCDFPGITPKPAWYEGQRLSNDSHPHLKLDDAMVSVPKVYPGDLVFWHCDVVHSVETEHHGAHDSSVMYIPAVPLTPANAAYVAKQKAHFLQGLAPPDFPQGEGEGSFVGKGLLSDIHPDGLNAMGFGQLDIPEGAAPSEIEAIRIANKAFAV
ncbi:hypothetical protein BOTBODRAFT_160721 [Botryobasidium botryosum FD-172 SS1]|uniref:DUF1479-domain-containing protein n=1 Tax=Botryobasidium botryosum (strain FD-172 SS1) TaxID=930990 RepID=A0A067MC25_BOTB1|nr:hypothetical protein BOTBODRAFT_160721 [Botryobasidium botryosum FD-172 SS1]